MTGCPPTISDFNIGQDYYTIQYHWELMLQKQYKIIMLLLYLVALGVIVAGVLQEGTAVQQITHET